jgi:hypothetical protein
MRVLPFLLLGLAACGGAAPAPARPLGVGAHLAEAERCEQRAAEADALADQVAEAERTRPPICGDVVLVDQTTSGGEKLTPKHPCWTSDPSSVARHRDDAARLRADARKHRRLARQLLAAEEASCAAMPSSELDHTPFAHPDDVAAVVAELDGAAVLGARIQFRPVAGLTAEWLRTAIACHRARAAALGYDPKYMAYDPSVVAGAEVTVSEGEDGPVVVIHGADDAAALVVYGRAEELVGGGW